MRLLLIGAFGSTWILAGCEEDPADGDGDGDADGDGDSDGDGDGDGDADAEICDNEIDDNGNSLTDCDDFACFDDPACEGGDGDADGDADGDGDGDADYPARPYGTALGDVIANLRYDSGNDVAKDIAGGAEFNFSDLYDENPDRSGEYTALMIFVTAGWCPYCADEAAVLEDLYQDLQDQGVLLLGIVTQTESSAPADAAYAEGYADRYGWTFPSIAGDVDPNYWPPADVAAGEIGLPLNMFVDLRTMQIYGRFPGAMTDMLMVELTLRELADEPQWGPDGTRVANFDCGGDGSTEVEPNGLSDSPEDGSSLPFTMDGTICPPTIADGFLLDEDLIDLGTLAAGTLIDVDVTRDPDSGVYPFASLLRMTGGSVEWMTFGPAMLDVESGGRQWVIDAAGHYYAAVSDGRSQSAGVYGEGVDVPPEDGCCYGGPDHTYTVVVSSPELTATEPALVIGDNVAQLDDGDLNVHPFVATAGTSYDFRMIADDNGNLDPYLVVVDAATGNVVGSNDDEAYPDNTNSLVTWTATADTTVYIVASYWGSWFFADSPPGYMIRVQ